MSAGAGGNSHGEPYILVAVVGDGAPPLAEKVVQDFAKLLLAAMQSGTAQSEMLTLLRCALKEAREKMLQELQVEQQGL